MSEAAVPVEVAAVVAEPTAAATPVSSIDVLKNLEGFFTPKEEAQVEEINPEIPDAAEVPDEVEAPKEPTKADEAKPEGEGDKAAETTEIAEEGSADFESLETKATPAEFPTIDELRTKYTRQNKEFYVEAARLSEEARKGHEAITKLGGDDYIEPLSKISTGLQTGETQDIFKGIIEAGSTEAFLKVVGDSLYLAMVKSQDFLTNPETEDFGKTLNAVAEQVIKQRFGGITPAEIDNLAKFSQSGWIEAIERWKESGFVDSDEWYEQIEADKDPAKFKSLQEKIKEKDLQLEQANKAIAEKETAKVSKIEQDFDNEGVSGLKKVLNEVVWKNSVLRDVASDSAEMKQEKSILRGILEADAANAFKTNAAREKLVTAYKRGDKATNKFQTDFSSAINTAVLNTKEKTAVFERMIAKLYGKTRNGSLPKPGTKATESAPAQSLDPTQTREFADKSQPTISSVEKGLEQAFAGL